MPPPAADDEDGALSDGVAFATRCGGGDGAGAAGKGFALIASAADCSGAGTGVDFSGSGSGNAAATVDVSSGGGGSVGAVPSVPAAPDDCVEPDAGAGVVLATGAEATIASGFGARL